MSSTFPTTLDALTDGIASSYLNAPDHTLITNDANDAIEKIEAKVGANASAVTTTHDYKLSGVTGTDKGVSLTGTETITNKILTSPVINTPTFSAGAVTTAAVADANVTEAKIVASSGFGLGVLRTARAKYSFAVDGGLVSTITLATNATIPDNAIIVGGTINSTTAATSGGLATISVGTSAGSGAASLLAATAVASFSLDALLNSVATFAAPVKMTAAGSITLTVATAALTAGIIEVTVLYFVAAA